MSEKSTTIKVMKATRDASRGIGKKGETYDEIENRLLARILRHWKATMEYHKTKDILYVMQLLGHRKIEDTLKYTQLVHFKDEDYTSKIAKNTEGARKLLEAGFEYVCTTPEEIMRFRKRK